MADCVYRFQEMRQAAGEIETLATQYEAAANKFQENFAGATGSWEGDSKNKMTAFVTGPVNEYMAQTVPSILRALSDILKANAEQMEKADAEIASNIPNSLGG